jgi:hypothetical protein
MPTRVQAAPAVGAKHLCRFTFSAAVKTGDRINKERTTLRYMPCKSLLVLILSFQFELLCDQNLRLLNPAINAAFLCY